MPLQRDSLRLTSAAAQATIGARNALADSIHPRGFDSCGVAAVNKRLCSLICAIFCVWSAASLLAEQSYFDVRGADFFEKTNFVFVGKLVGKESYRSEDGRFIFTRHVFQVEETIKGAPGSLVEITEYGGTLGQETLAVSHGPSYTVGQEYVVFSYVDLLRHNRTLAGPLGQFRVVTDSEGKRRIRVYPSHPLHEVLEQPNKATFQELDAWTRQLRKGAEKFSRQKKGGSNEKK